MSIPNFVTPIVCVAVSVLALTPRPASASTPSDTLEPIRLQHIQLGGFWKHQTKLLTEKWLPHCIRQMEKGGRGQELLNLVAAGLVLRNEPHGEYTGAPWSDAYIYNTIEAICLALAVDSDGDPDLLAAQNQLRSKIDEWIPIILAAQCKDGYIHSFHTVNGHARYSNIAWHEFYVMGYFLEMGVAHYRMSNGQDLRLYDAAVRCGDHLCATFGPVPKRTWKNGHAGLEYALCRLGRLVNAVERAGSGDKYIQLARHFLDHQHELQPNPYDQSNKRAIEMTEAEGHAVRATYFYTAMTDMALLTGSQDYEQAVDKIWTNAIQRKHYLTGGVGASHQGEAFSADFELPNDGYCESCAGCGLSFWSDRMHRLHKDGHYRDVQERTLYNNILGAMERSGENFFYQNPLDSDVARYPWHGCPCCVGNIPRALLAIKDLMYSVNAERDQLFLSHFVDSEAILPEVGGTRVRIQQRTGYPWQGDITVTLHPDRTAAFTLNIRIPDRTESQLYTAKPDLTERYTVMVNGMSASLPVHNGYVAITRPWQDGDHVQLSLPMEVQRVYCDPRVAANRGRVAIQRGPLTYNFEDVDHSQPVHSLVLQPDAVLNPVWKGELLGGIVAIQSEGVLAIPNFVRLNRGDASLVWVVEDPTQAAVGLYSFDSDVDVADITMRTVDVITVGHAKSEADHALQSERSDHGRFRGGRWRHASDGGWFSYRMKVAPRGPQTIFCVYWGGDRGDRRFTIRVDGEEIARQVLDNHRPGRFFSAEYPIPEQLLKGKSEVTIQFAAEPGATAGGIFDLRTLRAGP